MNKETAAFAEQSMPAVTLILLYLAVRRDAKSPEWCRDKLIGPMRDKAEKSPVRNVALINQPRGKGLSAVFEINARALTVFCNVCGKCERAKR